MNVNRRAGLLFAALITLVAALAGCGGSSSDDTSSPAATPSGEAVPELPKPTVKAPSGDPIVIADITDVSYPGAGDIFKSFPDSAQVAVEYVNEYLGGVDGRPLELWTCDSKNEPAATSQCANEALQQNPVAEIGLASTLAENGAKQLHEADIPTFNVPVSPAETSQEKSYPLGGGGLTEYPAMGYYAGAKLGAKSIGILEVDEAVGHFFAELISDAAKNAGVTDVNESYYKLTGTDITPSVVKAISGNPDVVGMTIGTSQALKAYKTFQQQGYPSEQLFGEGASASAANLEAAGDTVEGMRFTFEFENYDDLTNPDIKTFRGAMEKFAPSLDPRQEFMVWGFSNVMTIANALAKAKGDPTGKSLIAYMESTKRIPVFAGNALEKSAAPPSAPSLWNPTVNVIRWNAEEKLFENDSNGFFAPPVESE